jgi:hypothetical protein
LCIPERSAAGRSVIPITGRIRPASTLQGIEPPEPLGKLDEPMPLMKAPMPLMKLPTPLLVLLTLFCEPEVPPHMLASTQTQALFWHCPHFIEFMQVNVHCCSLAVPATQPPPEPVEVVVDAVPVVLVEVGSTVDVLPPNPPEPGPCTPVVPPVPPPLPLVNEVSVECAQAAIRMPRLTTKSPPYRFMRSSSA